MIIATPPFEPSRIVRTFNKAHSEQKVNNNAELGFSEKAKIAAKAAVVAISTEIGFLLMV